MLSLRSFTQAAGDIQHKQYYIYFLNASQLSIMKTGVSNTTKGPYMLHNAYLSARQWKPKMSQLQGLMLRGDAVG